MHLYKIVELHLSRILTNKTHILSIQFITSFMLAFPYVGLCSLYSCTRASIYRSCRQFIYAKQKKCVIIDCHLFYLGININGHLRLQSLLLSTYFVIGWILDRFFHLNWRANNHVNRFSMRKQAEAENLTILL